MMENHQKKKHSYLRCLLTTRNVDQENYYLKHMYGVQHFISVKCGVGVKWTEMSSFAKKY